MSDAASPIVSKLWSYCHVLRDDEAAGTGPPPGSRLRWVWGSLDLFGVLAQEIADDFQAALEQTQDTLGVLQSRAAKDGASPP